MEPSLRKTVLMFLKQLKIILSYDLATLLLDMYFLKMKSQSQGDISTPMFIPALFTIAKM